MENPLVRPSIKYVTSSWSGWLCKALEKLVILIGVSSTIVGSGLAGLRSECRTCFDEATAAWVFRSMTFVADMGETT